MRVVCIHKFRRNTRDRKHYVNTNKNFFQQKQQPGLEIHLVRMHKALTAIANVCTQALG